MAGGGNIGHSAVINLTVHHGGSRVGALVGNAASGSTINNSFATASISAGEFGSGLVGSSIGTIHNSYFVGSVETTGTATGYTSGGVSLNPVTLSNVYVAATVTAANTASFTGLAPDGADVTNSYWDSTLNSTTDGEGVGKTTTELKALRTDPGIFAGWSTDDWNFGTTSQYPVLKGLPVTAAEQCEAINTIRSTTIGCTY